MLKDILEKIVDGKIEDVDVELTEEDKHEGTLQGFTTVTIAMTILMGLGIGVGIGILFNVLYPSIPFGERFLTMKISFFIGIGFIIVTFSLGTLLFKKLQARYDEWKEKNGLSSDKYTLLNWGINRKARLHREAYLSSMKLKLKFIIFCTLNILGLLVVIFIPFKDSTAGTRDTILATLGIILMLGTIFYLTKQIQKTYRERHEAIEEIKEEGK